MQPQPNVDRPDLAAAHLAVQLQGAWMDCGKQYDRCRDLYGRFWLSCQRKIACYIRARLNPAEQELAEELAQTVFVKGWEQLHLFAAANNPMGWLIGIANNELANWGRAKQRSPHSIDGMDVPDCRHSNEVIHEGEASVGEQAEALARFSAGVCQFRGVLNKLAQQIAPREKGRGRPAEDETALPFHLKALMDATEKVSGWLQKIESALESTRKKAGQS